MLSSEEVAVCTCSQETVVVDCRDAIKGSCKCLSSIVGYSWSTLQIPEIN